ncbi:mucin-3A [Pelmatolapia mariae]|uniref:mucin-3A n=1 Tax=Pelmatolapia mariae TaxID=158779 RepID=UPI002FE640F5
MTPSLPDSQATVVQPNSSPTVPSHTSSSFSSSTTSVTYLTDTSTSETTTIVGPVTSPPTSSATLRSLCREADPQAYKTVKVINLSKGSVVAKSVAEYQYQNNETQIEFINTNLSVVLRNILQNKNNLNKISLAFGNQSVELNDLTFEAPAITNITELEPFINCTRFANYTAEISNGQWQCVGPCKKNPDYCNGHGQCLNDIYTGSVCRCYETSLEQFYGPQCDLFRRGPGFYGALFGSLAVALLLLIIIVIAVIVKRRHAYTWKRSTSQRRRLSFLEEDFFDFTDTGIPNLGLAGTYRSENI